MRARSTAPAATALRWGARCAARRATPAWRCAAASRRTPRKAGPKIQLVVALLLVPSVLLMVAAALASALLDSGGLPGT